MKWYVLYTRHHHERSVYERLQQKGFEVYMPLISSWRQSKRGARQVWIPLFPRYIFVRCYLEMYTHLELITMPGVLRLLEDDEKRLLVVTEAEIRILQQLSTSGVPLEQAAFPISGDQVEVREGPLQGITGVTLPASPGSVFVLLPSLQASVRVEVRQPPGTTVTVVKNEP